MTEEHVSVWVCAKLIGRVPTTSALEKSRIMEVNPKGTGFLRDLTSPCPCLEKTKTTMCSVSPAIHVCPSSGVLWTKENSQHVISLESRHATLGKQTNSKTVSKQSCR